MNNDHQDAVFERLILKKPQTTKIPITHKHFKNYYFNRYYSVRNVFCLALILCLIIAYAF